MQLSCWFIFWRKLFCMRYDEEIEESFNDIKPKASNTNKKSSATMQFDGYKNESGVSLTFL